jgi:hypothetical protein
MDIQLTDPLGRSITLHDRTWFGHILRGHPEMAEHRVLAESAVASPLAVHLSNSGPDSRLYFGRGPRPGLMILVVADVNLGLVKTAHLAKHFSGGDLEWS